MVDQVDEPLLAAGRCARATSSSSWPARPPGVPGSTNAVRVHHIGDAKNRVAPAYSDIATGAV